MRDRHVQWQNLWQMTVTSIMSGRRIQQLVKVGHPVVQVCNWGCVNLLPEALPKLCWAVLGQIS